MSSSIKVGIIKRNKNQPSQLDMQYEMRFMDESNLGDIMGLQEIIVHNLADKEMVVCRIFCKLGGPVIPHLNPYP